MEDLLKNLKNDLIGKEFCLEFAERKNFLLKLKKSWKWNRPIWNVQYVSKLLERNCLMYSVQCGYDTRMDVKLKYYFHHYHFGDVFCRYTFMSLYIIFSVVIHYFFCRYTSFYRTNFLSLNVTFSVVTIFCRFLPLHVCRYTLRH